MVDIFKTKKVKSIEESMIKLQMRIARLESNNIQKTQEIYALEDTISKLTETITTLIKQVSDSTGRIDMLDKRISENEKNTRQSRTTELANALLDEWFNGGKELIDSTITEEK